MTVQLAPDKTYPLPVAAKKWGVSLELLTNWLNSGKIKAVYKNGEIQVTSPLINKTKDEIIEENFAHLKGQKISASEASRKYSKLHGITIYSARFSDWNKAGYVKAKSDGYRLQLDEADAAYCAYAYVQKYKEYNGHMQGVNIFDKDGNPYQLKYAEVAKQMRLERRQARQAAQAPAAPLAV